MENGQAIGTGAENGQIQQRDMQQHTNWGKTRVAFGLPSWLPRFWTWKRAYEGLSFADIEILAVICK